MKGSRSAVQWDFGKGNSKSEAGDFHFSTLKLNSRLRLNLHLDLNVGLNTCWSASDLAALVFAKRWSLLAAFRSRIWSPIAIPSLGWGSLLVLNTPYGKFWIGNSLSCEFGTHDATAMVLNVELTVTSLHLSTFQHCFSVPAQWLLWTVVTYTVFNYFLCTFSTWAIAQIFERHAFCKDHSAKNILRRQKCTLEWLLCRFAACSIRVY